MKKEMRKILKKLQYGKLTVFQAEQQLLDLLVVSGSLPLAEDIQKRLIDFFKLEADLKFCKREYYERVEWYFETYQDELFGLPKRASESNDR